MQKIIDFDIRIPDTAITHIKEKSWYDHNFYKIDTYGDWLYGKLNIILQKYNECENVYSYEYGYFIDDKFVAELYWTTEKDIFEGIE